MDALDRYIATAEKDRESSKADRIQQEKDRQTMNRLTMAIMVAALVSAGATAWGALHQQKPINIVVPAPTVNITAPPAVVIPVPAAVGAFPASGTSHSK